MRYLFLLNPTAGKRDCTTGLTPAIHAAAGRAGIPPEKLATIFDGSSSTTSTSPDGRKGMGIGLSICKTIILAHGGEIKAINHTRGAEFYFTLPKEDK